MPVTQKDIALLKGISRQAVAAALEGDSSSRVSAATREKVLKLARELNYVPNAAARNLRGGKSRTIGILHAPGMPHSSMVYAEICLILRSYGYTTLSMDHAVGELPLRCNQLASCGVCGIIVTDCINTPSKLLPMPDLPIVFCRTKFGWSDVDVDKEMTGYLATSHLIEHGHKNIAYLTSQSAANNRREQGWQRALKSSGAAGRIIEMRQMDGSADQLINVIRDEKITAIFCSNDFLAGNVFGVLSSRNWKIPEDIALVGCDGCSFVQYTAPGITTIIQPVHELAEKCVQMILERIRNHQHGVILERFQIQPRLWIGGSCGCSPKIPEHICRVNTTGNLEKDYRLNLNISPWETAGTENC
jgi:LacI family transcriptional regulator